LVKALKISVKKSSSIILRSVSMSIRLGDHLLVMGRSGSGKTTLLRALAGLETLHQGQITIDGVAVVGPEGRLVPGHPGVHYFPQDFGLSAFKTVAENIREVVPHLSETAVKRRTAQVLSQVGLKGFGKRALSSLSGGQRQRVGWARALAPQPRVLLMDEPFSNLDAITRAELLAALPEWLESIQCTLVLVAHEPQVARSLNFPLLVLEEGRVVFNGMGLPNGSEPLHPVVLALLKD
jgi:iron(III) transport system ATP-binding protein